MTKLISLSTLAVALFGMTSAAQGASSTPISQRYNFAGQSKATFKSAGIDFFFSDVPVNQAVNGRDLSKLPGKNLADRLTAETSLGTSEENLYQLTQVYDAMNKTVSGQAIGYHNRSDDTDVNMQIVVSNKLKPNTTYLISAKLDFVTNVSSEAFGIGGSADSNSFGLLASQNPWVAAPEGSEPSTPDEPSVPSNPGSNDEDMNNYYGASASFFIDARELKKIETAALASLSAGDLETLNATAATADKALLALYTKVLNSLPTRDDSSELASRISDELDQNVKAKLAEMDPEEHEQLKQMFGQPSDPTLVMAASLSNSNGAEAMLRVTTKDNNGKVVKLGVPSGNCNSGVKSWICDHYSYMGRINKGDEAANDGTWSANSVSTQKPLEFTTDASGKPIYLNINSHSGFEGLTVYYVTGLQYSIVEKK